MCSFPQSCFGMSIFCWDKNANDATKKNNLKSLYLFFQHMLPENIHTSPMVGILFYNPPPSGNSIQFHTFPQIVLVVLEGSFACLASSEPWCSSPRSVIRNPSSRWSLLSGCMDIFWTAQCNFFHYGNNGFPIHNRYQKLKKIASLVQNRNHVKIHVITVFLAIVLTRSGMTEHILNWGTYK